MGKILCATRGGEAAIETQEAAIRRAIDQNDELIFFYVVDIEFLVHAAYALRSDIVEEEIDKRSEEHTSELQSRENLVCRLLLEKKKKRKEECTTETHTR